MKIIMICAAAGLALTALAGGASAQDRPPSGFQDGRSPGGPGMQADHRDDRGGPGYQDRGPGGMNGDRGPGGNRGYRGHRRCRMVMHHHHRVRRCY